MCTTVLLIGTLVVMLRRRFFNKGSPPSPPPGSARGFRCRRANLFTSRDWRHLKVGRSNWHLMSQLSRGKEKQDSRQGRHLLPCVPSSPPCATCTTG
uniref:Secreted protein n=1 Tax=Anser cygnoides TaxID=8845 RepID=A0A8B9DJC6_ANSCY